MNKFRIFLFSIISALALHIQAQTKCWFGELADDLAKPGATAEFKNLIKTDPDAFLAYKILHGGGRTNLRMDADALTAVINIRKNTNFADFGLTDNMLGRIDGWGNAGITVGYTEVLSNMDNFLNFVRVNNISCIEFDKFFSIFTTTSKTNKQAVYWILENIASDVPTFSNKTLKREIRVAKIDGSNGFIDIVVRSDASSDLLIEYKWYAGTNQISKETFLDEFIKRDLVNINSLDEVQWRVKGQKLSKEKVLEYLKEYSSELSPGMLSKFDKYAESINYANEINNVDDLFTFLKNNDSWYDLIFK